MHTYYTWPSTVTPRAVLGSAGGGYVSFPLVRSPVHLLIIAHRSHDVVNLVWTESHHVA